LLVKCHLCTRRVTRYVLSFLSLLERAKQTAMVGQTLGKLDKAIDTITTKLEAQAAAAGGGGGDGGGGGGGGGGM